MISTMIPILLAVTLHFQQAPTLDERIKQLEAEIEQLTKTLRLQEETLQSQAREIIDLRRRLSDRPPGVVGTVIDSPEEAATKPEPVAPTPSTPPAAAPTPEAPEHQIVTEVLEVDPEFTRVLLGAGRRERIKPGYRFEVYHDPEAKTARVALGEVDRLVGTHQEYALLKVVEGDVKNIKEGDTAVAIRAAGATEVAPALEPGLPRTLKVNGIIGEDLVLGYGAADGAVEGALVRLTRLGNPVATVRIKSVFKDFSVGAIVEKQLDPRPEDIIQPERARQPASGRIVSCDDKAGIIVDITRASGATAGMLFTVVREGKPVGKLQLTAVFEWGSMAKPHPDSKLENFRAEDRIEEVPPLTQK